MSHFSFKVNFRILCVVCVCVGGGGGGGSVYMSSQTHRWWTWHWLSFSEISSSSFSVSMFGDTYSVRVCLYTLRWQREQGNLTLCTVICKVNLHLSTAQWVTLGTVKYPRPPKRQLTVWYGTGLDGSCGNEVDKFWDKIDKRKILHILYLVKISDG